MRPSRETEREGRAIDLLAEAIELEGAERERYLDDACAGDATLRREVESMLAGESALADGFLEKPATAGLAETLTVAIGADRPVISPIPERLGPYRVVRRLGRGGMGSVYLGEQRQPVRRWVALKVIDAIHDRNRRKRFAAECQALARLGHPNVASLYEVGTTDGERPFVAMELVEGTAITKWCDQRELPPRQRIELFLGVCAGVRHAHEKGILHRDLKPSNVLVTEIDGRPTAKVIDFGIAYALDEPLLHDTPAMTLENQIIGSPAYLSPEAAQGERDLDTRADVYALGLMLYELVAGVQAIDAGEATLATLLRRLATEERTPPSIRFAGLHKAHQKQIAAARGLSRRALERRLRGDLDAIVGRAVARDRDRRYSSPADLAADLERHLAHEPVEARPSSATYALGRFVRRRPGVVLSVALVILALVLGVVARTGEARRANLEAERVSQQVQRAYLEVLRAQQTRRETGEALAFLVDLFEPGDVGATGARDLLDRGVAKARAELADRPLARARVLHLLGEAYAGMELFDPAEAVTREALDLRHAELPADHPEVVESADLLAAVERRRGMIE